MKLGSHISFCSPKYLVGSIEESINNGANALMIYLGPPQSTKRINDLTKFNLIEYEQKYQQIIPKENIVVHAPYILNLANFSKANFSKEFLIEEIKRMNYLGLTILVLHPGSYLNQDKEETLVFLANNLKEILNQTLNVKIYLETMAGKGNEIGSSLEELQKLILLVDSNRLGICLDTCHLNDAGYDLDDNLIKKLISLNLLDKVGVIHLNDSKNIKGSKKDRHANLNCGTINLKNLIAFIANKSFENIPIILETPFIENKSPYKEEIKLVKETIKKI